MQYYHDVVEIEHKEDNSPLTQADLAANRIIIDRLRQLDPTIPVLSEEGKIAPYETRKEWEIFWLVDPLDGTKEFLKRNGEFTVNIALIRKSMPVLGVVHLPAKGVSYSGSREEGAWRYDENLGRPKRIYSSIPDISKPVKAIVSRSHGSTDLIKNLKEKGIDTGEIILAGSSLKFCYVAEGLADIYPRLTPTNEWDTAAGDAVFRFSGSENIRFSPLYYNKPDLRNEGFILGLE